MPAIGRPTGSETDEASAGTAVWHMVKIMFSTGEYPFTSRRSGRCSRSLRTCGIEAGSPPVITWRTEPKTPGYMSSRKLSRLADTCIVDTLCSATSASITAGSGRWPGWSTQVPPENSAPNSSRAKASQETGEHCSQTSSGPKPTNSWPTRVATSARCEATTPLGRPVEPEVNITQATSSRPTARPRSSGACAAIRSASASSRTARSSGSRSA